MGFGPCFVMQYLVSFLVLYLAILAERERESWLQSMASHPQASVHFRDAV